MKYNLKAKKIKHINYLNNLQNIITLYFNYSDRKEK